MPTMGRMIAGARITAGMTQEELAEAVGVTESAVRKWEADVRSPRRNHLRAVAAAVDRPLRYFDGYVSMGASFDGTVAMQTFEGADAEHPGIEELLADDLKRRALEITDQEASDLRALYLGPGRRVDKLDDALQFLGILRRLQVRQGPDE